VPANRFDGTGMVVSRHRSPARQGARGNAGRTLTSGRPDRGPARPAISPTSRWTTCRSASGCSSWSARVARSKQCGSFSTSNTRNSYVFGAELSFRGCAFRSPGTTLASRSGPTPLGELGARMGVSGLGVLRHDDRIQPKMPRPVRIRTSVAAAAPTTATYGDPTIKPNPKPACLGQGARSTP